MVFLPHIEINSVTVNELQQLKFAKLPFRSRKEDVQHLILNKPKPGINNNRKYIPSLILKNGTKRI